ncbi:hypothetical protein HHK36_011423 [Tetracentron sinense]|uniref:Multiple myeloma tumor-associated protein 2-like N-terminal domain-containing protein n=1 Tax=Tetracentron sinense TaxID=13715 RepID=A0A835DH96_TETSI|nr:hypothetical protein HHK36_011423 [Tetracentron sinense]
MYHPSRGGVRGGRDQFKWDDVKVDKHRENYIGHSLKAPVGRWQKGKDLHWYTRDKNSASSDMEVAKAEIQRIKEEEEQAMREALGLAPKRASRPQGNRLDKHEFSELVKKGSTAEDLGEGHAEAAQVQGLGFSRCSSSSPMPPIGISGVGLTCNTELIGVTFRSILESIIEESEQLSLSLSLTHTQTYDICFTFEILIKIFFIYYHRAPRSFEESSSLPPSLKEVLPERVNVALPNPPARNVEEAPEDERNWKKRSSREEKKHKKHEKREKRRSRDSDDEKKHRRDKKRRRHDSD